MNHNELLERRAALKARKAKGEDVRDEWRRMSEPFASRARSANKAGLSIRPPFSSNPRLAGVGSVHSPTPQPPQLRRSNDAGPQRRYTPRYTPTWRP